MAPTDPSAKPKEPTSTATAWAVPALIVGMAVLVIFMIAGNWNHWTSSRGEQSTDDAYLRADLTPLSTKVAGTVARVAVADYQEVKAGDLLVQLRDDDYRAQVAQAEAAIATATAAIENNHRQKALQEARIQQAEAGIHLAQAEIQAAQAGVTAADAQVASARSGQAAAKADALQAKSERTRQEALVASQSATRQKLEQVIATEERFRAAQAIRDEDFASAAASLASRNADVKRAQAHLESSRAEVEAQRRARAVMDSQEMQLRADLDAKRAALLAAQTGLDYTRIVAPAAGKVSERRVRLGQLVSPGTQVITLVESSIWVQANFKETQVRYMRPGDPVEIRVDAFPSMTLRGKVEQISPASGSQFALLPADNATGNFTKVVQRVPVKITLSDSNSTANLRPGLSVVASVRVNKGGAGAAGE